MKVAVNHAVSIEYTLKNAQGEILDQSPEGAPLEYLHGHNNLISGLEKQLADKAIGEEFDAAVAPEEAYGVRNPELIQKYPKQMFQGVDEIVPGMQFHGQNPQGGIMMLTVTAVEGEEVEVDGNHPLAGEELFFSVKIADIREGTDDEVAQGRIAPKHQCGCGGHGGHGNGGGCGHHEHDDDHECCGGHGHDDDHECCGGHGSVEEGTCCGGGHHH